MKITCKKSVSIIFVSMVTEKLSALILHCLAGTKDNLSSMYKPTNSYVSVPSKIANVTSNIGLSESFYPYDIRTE